MCVFLYLLNGCRRSYEIMAFVFLFGRHDFASFLRSSCLDWFSSSVLSLFRDCRVSFLISVVCSVVGPAMRTSVRGRHTIDRILCGRAVFEIGLLLPLNGPRHQGLRWPQEAMLPWSGVACSRHRNALMGYRTTRRRRRLILSSDIEIGLVCAIDIVCSLPRSMSALLPTSV